MDFRLLGIRLYNLSHEQPVPPAAGRGGSLMQHRVTLRTTAPPATQRWDLPFMAALAAFTLSLGIFGFVLAAMVADDPGGGPSPGTDGAPGGIAEAPAARQAPDGNPLPVPMAEDSRLQAAILDELGPNASRYGVVVRRLSDGLGATVNPGRVFYAASTFKLAVLYEAERRRSLGELDFSATLELTPEDLDEDLGTLADLPLGPDGTLTIAGALEAMIVHSDNASAVALMHLLGAGAIDETLASLGLRHTSVNTRELPTTAADMALLMEAIARGAGVDAVARAHMRELLLAQLTRTGIPAGLPVGVIAGNKTGTWENATHDVAFVEAPGGTYVIAVLSEAGWEWDPVARVSRAVYGVLSR